MIHFEAAGDREVAARLEMFSPKLMHSLIRHMSRITFRIEGRTKSEKLSGQVLGVVTGRLRRSITGSIVQRGDVVTGIVSTAVPYGIGWETGWEGAKTAATDKFAVGGDSFKNGSSRRRAFLVPTLIETRESGFINSEIQAAIDEAKT